MNKKTQENIRQVTESEIEGYDLEKLEARQKKFASLVSDCDDIISDCVENLQTAAKMEDIDESKKLKARINDAAANREIFELKVKVVSARIRQVKHDKALVLCGDNPTLPYGVDPVTFGVILDNIYEHTEQALIGDSKSTAGKKMAQQIKAVVKSNPKLKEYIKEN